MAMPTNLSFSEFRKVAEEAANLLGILQGTMSLEGQGLDRVELRRLKRRMVRRLLGLGRRYMNEAEMAADPPVRRVLFGDLRLGETPIDDFEGLLVPDITTLRELSRHEAANIADAVVDYLRKAGRCSAMSGPWAGQFRKREVNSIPLTSTHHQIPMHLSDLFESMALWQDHIADVIARAAMLHHRAVQIRPFVNGNGRWARLRTDAWLLEAKGVVIRWPRDMGGGQPDPARNTSPP